MYSNRATQILAARTLRLNCETQGEKYPVRWVRGKLRIGSVVGLSAQGVGGRDSSERLGAVRLPPIAREMVSACQRLQAVVVARSSGQRMSVVS